MKTNTVFKFIFVFLIFTSIGFIVFYVEKTIREKFEAVKAQAIIDSKAENLKSGNQLIQGIQILNQQETIIENSFISSENVLDFIRTIEEMAANKGLKIIIEKVERGDEQTLLTKGKTISIATFTLQSTGPYDSVMSFIEELLKNEKKLTLTQINLYRSDASGKIEYTARIKMEGIILTYE